MACDKPRLAADEKNVSILYQNSTVASKYIQQRFMLAWQQLLHKAQVRAIQQCIRDLNPENILEIAPGPARLTTELTGVRKGTLLEYSHEMIEVARDRLKNCNLLDAWTIICGNAFEAKDCPGPFDFVYTFRFIRHFDEVNRLRLYDTIRSRLKYRGVLMFDVVNTIYNQQSQPSENTKSDALPVFDAGYTPSQFRAEMKAVGFEVLHLRPVIRHFRLQVWISSKLHDLTPRFSFQLNKVIEAIPSRSPLEWIATCRKTEN